MPFETFPDIISSALKNDIIRALTAARNALDIDSDFWDGESKIAYDNFKASIQRDLVGLETTIGEL